MNQLMFQWFCFSTVPIRWIFNVFRVDVDKFTYSVVLFYWAFIKMPLIILILLMMIVGALI